MSLDRIYIKLRDGSIAFLTDHTSKMYQAMRIENRSFVYIKKSELSNYAEILPNRDQVRLAEESLNNFLDSQQPFTEHKMNTPYVSLELTYSSDLYPQYDKKIEDIIGWSRDASGMGCGDRDLAFIFHVQTNAIEFGKLLKSKCPELTRIYVQKWEDNNWHPVETIK